MKFLAKMSVNYSKLQILLRFGCTYSKRHLGSASVAALTTVNKGLSYVHVTETRPILGATIGQLINLAPDRFGDRLAVIDCAQGIRKSHVEMKNDIDRLATGFLALNFQRGDRLAIWCTNKYEWVLTHLAAIKAGLLLVTINPAFQPNELAYCLAKVGVRALVFPESFKTQNYYEMTQKVIPEVADSKPGQIKSKTFPKFDTVITLSDKDFPGTFKFYDIMNAGGSREKEQLEKLQTEIQFDDAANIQFTSGTTGKPKAAILTHIAMIKNCINVGHRVGFIDDESARICCKVPLFHAYATVAVSTNTVVVGTGAVFPTQGYSAEDSLKAIEREKCTTIYGTPTMYVDLLNHPNFPKTDVSSVKNGFMGGSPCPPELIKQVMEKLNCPGMMIGYGSTESSLLMSCHDNATDDINIKIKNAGRPAPHTEMKIVDAKDRIVPLGTPGEICSRGVHIMKGYWGDEEKTKEIMKNGWYHTGDMGTLDEGGYLTVVGRIKDIIIRGGENIFPVEIEDFLISHPKISDAYVIGVPDKRMGEEICAWIRLKTNETITETEVKEFCKGQIAHFKIPKYIKFVDSFPVTATGKVQKYVMREEMIKILDKDTEK